MGRLSKKRRAAVIEDDEMEPMSRGVIYLGHIPHGFYEDEMRGFFSQFGRVTRVRLARSRKTANSRGYAFVEFEYDEVAKIAASTMNNYIMWGRLLKCSFIPKERVHPATFKGWDRPFRRISKRSIAIARHNKAKTAVEFNKQVERLVKREQKKRSKLDALGISYEFPGYESLAMPKAKHIKFTNN
ncbi:MKI67 FHA domain-interacting nucleolar phosphoprotein-like [Oscarella lobularis]|uniref:MKI67 FHA domain-interacting nucleolar phosphoprotein-like n=1 Tax=Oscarella lobularis TaxID=121494 RepID=UPI003314260C